MMYYNFPLFGFFMPLYMIIVWIIIIGGIALLINWSIKQNQPGKINEKSALDILRERYAKGEIDQREFEAKKKKLS
ncbi:MAG: SHOCT domain-containing protein [bacterium]|nr:SHOCT domain-containing protein [bacterium]